MKNQVLLITNAGGYVGRKAVPVSTGAEEKLLPIVYDLHPQTPMERAIAASEELQKWAKADKLMPNFDIIEAKKQGMDQALLLDPRSRECCD